MGVFLSALAFHQYVKIDEDRLHQRVLRGTNALAVYSSFNSTSSSLGQVLTTLLKIQEETLAGELVSQKVLENFTFIPDPQSGETINLRYIPKVTLNRQNGHFEMLDSHGEIKEFPYPIQDSHLEGLRPASDVGEYYPIMLQATAGIDNGVNARGLNHFNDHQFHLIMDQARDMGFLTGRTTWPLITATEPFIISHFYMPLYTPGPVPQTISERRARHTGFISAVSFTPAEGFINLLPDSFLGLEAAFVRDTDALNAENFDPALKTIMASGAFAEDVFTNATGTIHVFGRSSYSLKNAMITSNRWWALSIGLLLTTWICSMLYLLRNRTKKLSALVDERTRDLFERSQRLSEVNDALGESENRYRMLADNANDVIFTHDLNGICTYISPSITQQSGFLPEDYLGKPIYIHFTEDAVSGAKKILRESLPVFESQAAIPPPKTLESKIFCKDGSIKVLETTIAIMCDDGDKPVGYLGVSRDITERKKNEEEKAALKSAFYQSQKMEAIGTLAGGVAHDFNNLLTGILGHAELLKTDGADQKERTRSVQTIETAAIRARELTSQLLGFARKGHYQKVPVSINRVLHDSISFLQRTFEKNIEIDFEDCAEELVVSGDPGQLSQVFLNLSVNARDAMPIGGTLKFQLSRQVLDQSAKNATALSDLKGLLPGDYCKVVVSDTGIGIPKSEISRIFEPFYTSKPQGKGTGLGLAMVYGVTESHGGTITVTSQEGVGTTFVIYLPLSEEKYIAPETNGDKELARGHGNILVIDDEALVRDMVEAMLSNLGYQSAFAVDGHDGVNYYREHHQDINLVIVDMSMPNMGGLECIERLIEINPKVKVILSTGYSQDSIPSELEKPNISGFLQKPFRLKELAQMLADILAKEGKGDVAQAGSGRSGITH